LRQIIGQVWAEMAPSTPFDETLTWRDAGIDSLKTLHFLLRLEQRLGRPVTFDMITRDMTLGDLIVALSDQSPKPPHAGSQMPCVFLVPGMFGDEARLAEFRRSLAGVVQFETLALPTIDQPSRSLADLNAAASYVVEQIVALAPTGSLHLAGYSLGGLIAFQTATDLIALGRDVRLVCLLDSMLGFDPETLNASRTTNLTPAYLRPDVWERFFKRGDESPIQYVERVAFGALVRTGFLEPARRLAKATGRHRDIALDDIRRRRVLGPLRARAILSWRPRPCAAPVLLIASDDFARYCPADAWAAVAPDLTVQRVPGGHTDIFEPAALATLNPALLAALERAAAA
jgi:thioesterase domain-containing protein/acyl carrier protein